MCDFKIWGDKLAGELNVMRWWFAGLGAFSAQGGPFGCCKCGAAAGLVCESAKMAHCRPKTANRWLEVPDWSIVFQKQTQKKLFGKPRPLWQVLLRNVQISVNLAQNLSRWQRLLYSGRRRRRPRCREAGAAPWHYLARRKQPPKCMCPSNLVGTTFGLVWSAPQQLVAEGV